MPKEQTKKKTRKGEGNKGVFLAGIGIAVMFGQYFSSVVHAAGDDESEKENHRYKGRFSSQQQTSAFNKLAKANLKRPLDEKTTMIETNFEPEKKMTRSRMVSLKNMHQTLCLSTFMNINTYKNQTLGVLVI